MRTKPPGRPKLGALIPVIDAILEADRTAPVKQQHTAKRIFERLRDEHGYSGGYTVVKDYVRRRKMRSREGVVRLSSNTVDTGFVASYRWRAVSDFTTVFGVHDNHRMAKMDLYLANLTERCQVNSWRPGSPLPFQNLGTRRL